MWELLIDHIDGSLFKLVAEGVISAHDPQVLEGKEPILVAAVHDGVAVVVC